MQLYLTWTSHVLSGAWGHTDASMCCGAAFGAVVSTPALVLATMTVSRWSRFAGVLHACFAVDPDHWRSHVVTTIRLLPRREDRRGVEANGC